MRWLMNVAAILLLLLLLLLYLYGRARDFKYDYAIQYRHTSEEAGLWYYLFFLKLTTLKKEK